MDLSSPLFLFLFLPVFLLIYLVSAGKARTGILLLASVIFLAWGDASAILWLGGILVSGYWMGLAIAKAQETGQSAAKWLWAGLGVNVILLAFFKYLTAFGQEGLLWLNTPETWVDDLSGLTVPIGLSYVTFQLIAYLVDVWKGNTPAEKNFVSFSAYLLFFPKLVSGPITRYKPFVVQMEQLNPSMDDVAAGFRRLLSGFIKRTVIANQLALMANAVFNQPTANVEPKFAWLGLAAYTLQIFFDFSGYTDMALGLGLMIGVRLPENFNFPYIAQSVSDFWRRWHITLSTWFREYVFYPLERKRFKWMGQQVNILIVFLLTGLWHGFNPTFMVWGMIHGIALAVESLGFGRWLKGAWRPLQHLYTLTIVVIGWVFFRSQDLNFAFEFFRRLAGDRSNLMPLPFSQTTPIPFIEPSFIMALIAGILFSFPLTSLWRQLRERFESRQSNSYLLFQVMEDAALLLFFILGLGLQLSGSFLPNLYAKF
ncbi:MAG TPA: MBOAT family O-acyltransferase [Anaerolineales bacterium]|nr:MBOAT family O-acyltransferase [Anaerolineales bacterium]HNH05170.1 MBOAT family O-acyltransferase [Anaerolineales bacterium]